MMLGTHLHVWGGHMGQEFIRVPIVLKTPAEEKQQIKSQDQFLLNKKENIQDKELTFPLA